MQTVSSAFNTMAQGNIRYPIHKALISWLKDYDVGIDLFTIGTSLIGGTDIIAGDGSNIVEADKFSYDDETEHVMLIEYERELLEPVGSVTRAMSDILLDNNTDRFTPGSDPDIGDFILPRRPIKLSLGFNLHPLPEVVQIFVGEIAEYPELLRNDNLIRLHCRDFFDTIWDTPLQNSVLYQDAPSDEVLAGLLQLAGLATDQYDLDAGINVIKFAYFEKGQKLGPIIQKIVEAELGRFYLDELGLYRFENRQHWLNLTTPVLTISESMVKEENIPNQDKIVNVVEVTAAPRAVMMDQLLWQSATPQLINPGETVTIFTNYDDPVANIDLPAVDGATSRFRAALGSDGSGTDMTSAITMVSWDDFSQASKGVFTNDGDQGVYLILTVWGQPARVTSDIFVRYQDDDSVATYGEHVVQIDNNFIQSSDFAQTIAQMLVTDRKTPGDYRELTIIGHPALQLGDLVTWQGNDYNILRIKGRFSAADGLIQVITLVKRTLAEYFTIGVSTIGGTDQIAP